MALLILQQSASFQNTLWFICRYLTRSKSTNITTYAKHELLNTINTSGPEILLQYRLSPYTVQRIIMERDIIGGFKALSDIESTGIRDEKLYVLNKVINKEEQSVEELQRIIASYSSSTSYGIESQNKIFDASAMDHDFNKRSSPTSQTKKKKKSAAKIPFLTTPCYEMYENQKINRITAISLSFSHIGLTTLDIERRVEDISTLLLFSDFNGEDFQYPHLHELYEKVLMAAKQLPESDLFIIEKSSTSNFSAELGMFSLMKAMLLSLLDNRNDPGDLHSVIFLKNIVVSKLYNLRVGTERKSGIDLGESILAGKCNLQWMPSVSFNPVALQKYILSSRSEKIQMIESLMLALAFDSVFIKKDYASVILL